MSLEKCKDVIDNWIDKYKNSERIGVFCAKRKENNDKIGMAYIIGYKEPDQLEIGFSFEVLVHPDGEDGLLYRYVINKEG